MYGCTSGQLRSTYQTILSQSTPASPYSQAPIKFTPWLKTDTSPTCKSSSRYGFLPGRLNLVSTSSKYLEQNVMHSSTIYASAIDPSGLAVFRTYRFNVSNLLSTGYIQPYCTGPLSLASFGKWTAKCTITSKKAGGKICSSLQRMTRISFSSLFIMSTFSVLQYNSLKKFPSLATASYISSWIVPRKPAGNILWSRI